MCQGEKFSRMESKPFIKELRKEWEVNEGREPGQSAFSVSLAEQTRELDKLWLKKSFPPKY